MSINSFVGVNGRDMRFEACDPVGRPFNPRVFSGMAYPTGAKEMREWDDRCSEIGGHDTAAMLRVFADLTDRIAKLEATQAAKSAAYSGPG